MTHKLALLLILALFGIVVPRDAAPAPLQEEQETADTFTLDLRNGMNLEDFVDLYADLTGKRVFFDQRRLGSNTVIFGFGNMTFPKSEAEAVFSGILHAHGMAVLPTSSRGLNMHILEDIKTGQFLKQYARFVELEHVQEFADRPSEIISTVLPLENVSASRMQRALNNIIQEHRAGFVHPIEEANCLLITNFANTVHEMVQMAQTLDRHAGTENAEKWRKRIKSK